MSLAVPSDAAFESLVGTVADDVARRAELPDSRRETLRAAVCAAFDLVLERAQIDSQKPVRLHFTESPRAVTLSLMETGMPIDAAFAARDRRWEAILAHADSAAWHWHGAAGTELLLRLDHVLDEEAFAHERPEPEADAQLAPDRAYVVRRFAPGDARAVARCFYATYGRAYDFPAVYEPRRLNALNANGEYVSFVALDERGDVVGHYALRREPGAPIAEGCGAVVDPRHRRRGLLTRLRVAAEAYACEIGLSAFFTEPVTDHAVTQNESEKMGARVTAISLGHSPRGMSHKHMDVPVSFEQRQSLTLYVKALEPAQPQTIYAPAEHRDMIADLYSGLGIPVEFREGGTAGTQGCVRAGVDRALQTATIAFESAGGDAAAIAEQAIKDFESLASLGAIYAMLPLTDPATPILARKLEQMGFFFSGVAPWMLEGKDALRLQRLLAPIDTSRLVIVSPLGQKLLAYIEAARSRA